MVLLLEQLVAALTKLKAALQARQDAPGLSQPVEPLQTSSPAPAAFPVPPAKAQQSLLDEFVTAICAYEGGFQKGTRPYRLNNPCDLRYVGAKPYPWEAVGRDPGNFLIFPTWEAGYEAGKAMIRDDASGKSRVYRPTTTIRQFFAIYAPSSDANDPDAYATFVAKRLGLPVDTPISRLLA